MSKLCDKGYAWDSGHVYYLRYAFWKCLWHKHYLQFTYRLTHS